MWTDTQPAQRARYFEHLSRMTLAQKWARFGRLVADGRALARAGLRQRHPDADDAELEIRLAALLYGRAAAACLGPVPEDAMEPVDAPLP